MATRILMTCSAAFLAALGLGITFLPQELLVHLGVRAEGPIVLLVQVLGASYLGGALLNWMTRGIIIGGIYGRPVAMANFFHFAVGSLALLRGMFALHFRADIALVAAVYSVFAVWFGLVLFTHPREASPK